MGDTAQWISVGELAEAFGPGNHTPPSSGDLAGAMYVLRFDGGRVTEHRFLSDSRLHWRITEGEGRGEEAEETYFAFKVREGVYFVDFVEHQARATAVSLVLDLGRKIATALIARLPDSADVGESLWARVAAGKELTAVAAQFRNAAIDRPFTAATERHLPTADLVGRRVEYTYSPTEQYEHVYLNEDFYTWQCLRGSEKGLADTDRCHYLKLGDDLFLFVWREKIVPTIGVVVVDFAAMRTMGKIFGHAPASEAAGPGRAGPGIVDFAVGAHARLLNVTVRGEVTPP